MTWVKNLTAGLALAVAIVNGSGSALAQKKVAGSQITTFDPPGAVNTFPLQILNSGTIVGYYIDDSPNAVVHGFTRTVDGQYTIIDVPGATSTQALGINDEGTVVGWGFDAPGANGSVYHGYLRDKDGNFTPFDVPGAGPYQLQGPSPIVVIPLPSAINRDGTVAGSYVDPKNVNHGFVRSSDGQVITFDAPGAGTGSGQGTVGNTTGINRQGAITGGYFDSNGATHAYLTLQSDPEGAITSFDAPGAGKAAGQGSYFNMITDAGMIPGVSIDSKFVQHGFILSRDGTLVKVDVAGAGTGQYQGTLTSAANVAGITAGTYIDGNGVNHGFVRPRHGKITTFDVPGEGTGSGQGVVNVGSINEEGAVAGWYADANGANHGFIYQYRGEDH